MARGHRLKMKINRKRIIIYALIVVLVGIVIKSEAIDYDYSKSFNSIKDWFKPSKEEPVVKSEHNIFIHGYEVSSVKDKQFENDDMIINYHFTDDLNEIKEADYVVTTSYFYFFDSLNYLPVYKNRFTDEADEIMLVSKDNSQLTNLVDLQKKSMGLLNRSLGQNTPVLVELLKHNIKPNEAFNVEYFDSFEQMYNALLSDDIDAMYLSENYYHGMSEEQLSQINVFHQMPTTDMIYIYKFTNTKLIGELQSILNNVEPIIQENFRINNFVRVNNDDIDDLNTTNIIVKYYK